MEQGASYRIHSINSEMIVYANFMNKMYEVA